MSDTAPSPHPTAGARPGRRRPLNLAYLGLLPSWLIMGFALLLPILIVGAVSVSTRGAYGGFDWGFDLTGYRQILFNEGWEGDMEFTPQYLFIILRTLILAGLTTLLCLILAVPVSYFIAQQSPGRKALLVYLVTLPFWMSLILRVYAWMIILGKDGPLPRFLEIFGAPSGLSLMHNDGATLAAMVYTYIPLMVLPVFA